MEGVVRVWARRPVGLKPRPATARCVPKDQFGHSRFPDRAKEQPTHQADRCRNVPRGKEWHRPISSAWLKSIRDEICQSCWCQLQIQHL